MKAIIAKKIEEALEALQKSGELTSFVLPEIRVDYPKDEQFGEYTSNIALVLAKLAGKSPRDIAELLQSRLAGEIFEKIEVAGPGHLNFSLSSKYFSDIVSLVLEQKNLQNLAIKKEKVMVEYSQPNTHKEFHIGHLRNVFIGNTLVNVLRKAGDEVIAANYIGDTGTHIAKCLWGITTFYKDQDLEAIENKAEFLGKVYSEATQKIEENPEYEAEFKALQTRFEAGDEELVHLWKKTRDWSMEEFERIYSELGIKFDEYFFESIEEQSGKKLLPELLEKGILKESEGAIVANLEAYDLGVLVLVRKDGSALYGLKDIPLAKKKFEKYGVEKSVYVVDIRQGLYFKQLFKILELYGFQKTMVHYGYEFVALKGGETMSSRKGNIIPAQLIIDETEQKVKKQFPDSPFAKDIALGALRFSMLRHSASSKIEFDIEESIRLEGATGPYVQYAHARIASILTKAKEKGIEITEKGAEIREFHEKEKELIREISKFPELLQEVRETYEVHKLAHYVLRIADKFHSFYNDCQVIDEKNISLSQERLKLVSAVKMTISDVLVLMGISAPEKM